MARIKTGPVSDTKPNSKTRHTIHDIAEATGVSPKTVSFVLNNKEGVAEKTRRRVLKAVDEMHYRPHMGARALRDRVTRSIGVIFPATAKTAPLSRNLLVWLYDELISIFGSRGYYVTFDMAMQLEGNGNNGDYARGVWEQAFGPCFLAGPLALDDTVVRRLHERDIPYLAVTRLESFPECSAASVDYEQAAYLSATYLIDKGHTRIGLLKAFEGYQSGLERRRGYERALREAGLPIDESLIRPVTFDTHTIVNDVHGLLRHHDITALIDCSSTEDPTVLREGARRAGRRLGEDIETVVWTYRYDTVVLPEASAHICLPLRQAAAEGLEELAVWVEGKRQGPIQILYPPHPRQNAHRTAYYRNAPRLPRVRLTHRAKAGPRGPIGRIASPFPTDQSPILLILQILSENAGETPALRPPNSPLPKRSASSTSPVDPPRESGT